MAKAYLVRLITDENDDDCTTYGENIGVALTKEKAIEAINEDFKNRQWAELEEREGIYHLRSELRHYDKFYLIEELDLV